MKSTPKPAPVRPRAGRPLSFDRQAALEKAMLVFWRHGYETTSVSDLTRAMQITAPSLYTAFGDKRRLFLDAVNLYAQGALAATRAFEEAAMSRQGAEDMLSAAAHAYTGAATPKGCLLASATASGSEASADVQQAVADVRREIGRRVRVRIRRDIEEGLLPAGADAEALSGLLIAVMQGMSVLARDGASRASLLRIAQAALAAWP